MTLVYVNNDDDAGGAAASGPRRSLDAASRMRVAEAGGQGGVVLPGPQDRLPRRLLDDDEQAAVWWLGAHGGAGESTLEELFSGSRAADHSWPLTAADLPPARVVLDGAYPRAWAEAPRSQRSANGRPATRKCCCSAWC